MKTRGLTRRQLAVPAAALPAVAQNVASPAKPADELGAAREQVRQASGTLRKFKVATSVEPSFVFRP